MKLHAVTAIWTNANHSSDDKQHEQIDDTQDKQEDNQSYRWAKLPFLALKPVLWRQYSSTGIYTALKLLLCLLLTLLLSTAFSRMNFSTSTQTLLLRDSAALQLPLWPAAATILAYWAFNCSFLQNQCSVGFFITLKNLIQTSKLILLLSKWLRKQYSYYYTDKYNNVILSKNEHEYIKIQCVNKNTEKVIYYRKKKSIFLPFIINQELSNTQTELQGHSKM